MSLRVSLAQVNLLVGDVGGNLRRVVAAATHARDTQRADVVVFPELTLTGYPPEDLLLRPEFDLRAASALDELRLAVSGIHLVVGYPRVVAGRRYNAAGVLRDGQVLGEYHKALLPNYSVFDEKRYFEPGSEPCVVDIRGVPVGLTICEDIWYPSPAARAREAGARLLLNLNASPFHKGKAPEREGLVGRRARDNGLPIVYVNLVGGQDELVFDGGSFAVDAEGRITHRLGSFVEEQGLFEYAPDDAPHCVAGAQAAPLGEDEAIYRALVLGVRDYVHKNGFRGAVLGLSGGIDSALVLCIAVDALGADQVEVLSMPSRYTAGMSNEDAAAQAAHLGVKHRVIPIERRTSRRGAAASCSWR